MSSLRAENLAKSYSRRWVVSEVSFVLEQGEVLGLLGPNGAGKTMCFSMVAGVVSPDRGRIYIADREITRAPIAARSHAGLSYLPQGSSVFGSLTVADNVLAVLELRRELKRSERRKLCEQLLEEFGVTHLAGTRARALSGGERRRVEIARALATNPKYLLMDEPFAGVDPKAIADAQAVIAKLARRGIGILITDHNVRDTLTICDRALVISQGKIIAEGDRDAILANREARSMYFGDSFEV